MSKPGHAPFGWRQAVLLLIGFNVVVFLASLVIGFVFGVVSAASTGSVDVSRSSIFYSDGYVVITQTLAELIAAYWAYRYVRRRMAERWREGASTGVGWLPAPRIAYVMAVIMATILTAVFCVVIPPEFTEAPDEAFTYFIALEGVQWSSAVMILTLGIMTPFIEELLFRGAALAGFSESLGPRVAVVLVTITLWSSMRLRKSITCKALLPLGCWRVQRYGCA